MLLIWFRLRQIFKKWHRGLSVVLQAFETSAQTQQKLNKNKKYEGGRKNSPHRRYSALECENCLTLYKQT